ncbi:hypothetical protein ScPMuIL_005425 [Solemya velum]
MTTIELSLPALTPKYNGVPRRYEETRPVVIQEYAHRKILGIGHNLHCHSVSKSEQERLNAVHSAERQIWQQADQLKAVAVQKAREEAAIEQDLAIRKLSKQHEKKLKEEALRVEMAMQKLTMEQIKQEREEAAKQLKETIKQVEEQGHAKLQKAVEQVRQEERRNATAAAEKISKSHAQAIEQLNKKATDEKHQALQSLHEAKDNERIVAVKKTEEEHRRIILETINKLTQKYENEINNLKNIIALKNAETKKLLATIDTIKVTKEELRQKVISLRDEFQIFINKCGQFNPGQSDYMIPPLYVLTQ